MFLSMRDADSVISTMKNEINMYERDHIEILRAQSSHTFPLHSHESFCFGIVRSGEVCFRIGDQEETLTKGMVYVIPSNVGVTISAQERYEYITVCLKNRHRDCMAKYQITNFFPKEMEEKKFIQLCEEYYNKASSTYFMEGVHALLAPVMSQHIVKDNSIDFVEEAKTYIRNHIHDTFNLKEVAEAVHVSKFHLIRNFKQQVGVTPNQFYIQCKIFGVKQALKENVKETDLAVDFNFSDQSYLCNLFKKQMGITMKDFKRNFEQH